ncbi:hypothetical protein ANFP_10030 [Acidithiobacillus ferrooxidans]|nr:hypothetical protein ANFP_10030 [Acidithiobacillus ferrooxidans]
MFLVNPDGGIGSPQPELLSYQTEGNGVEAVGVLDVGIPVHLGLLPLGDLGRGLRQALQEGFLHLDELGEGCLTSGPVDPIARLRPDPLLELAIGIVAVTEIAQGQEGFF